MTAATITRERPIAFTAESVRAIIAGRKTQTRRVLTLKRREGRGGPVLANPAYVERWKNEPAHMWARECPYGQTGDRLWIRESWLPRPGDDAEKPGCVPPGHRYDQWTNAGVIYRATWDKSYGGSPWKSPYVMPRWASRLTLELTNVRVERLQQISKNDATREGFKCSHCRGYDRAGGCMLSDEPTGCVGEFRAAWDTLNAKRGYSWESNPWVWVLEFRRVER